MDLLIIADQCSARRLWVSILFRYSFDPFLILVLLELLLGQNCFGREESYRIMFQSLSLVNSRPAVEYPEGGPNFTGAVQRGHGFATR